MEMARPRAVGVRREGAPAPLIIFEAADRSNDRMKSGRAKRLAPFQGHFSFEIFDVAADAGDCGELVPGSENYGDVFGFQIARYSRAIAAVAVADIVHMQVEM